VCSWFSHLSGRRQSCRVLPPWRCLSGHRRSSAFRNRPDAAHRDEVRPVICRLQHDNLDVCRRHGGRVQAAWRSLSARMTAPPRSGPVERRPGSGAPCEPTGARSGPARREATVTRWSGGGSDARMPAKMVCCRSGWRCWWPGFRRWSPGPARTCRPPGRRRPGPGPERRRAREWRPDGQVAWGETLASRRSRNCIYRDL
jgi:hypothetical protein